uniref:NADH-ubiquinone oxidoreductase chain 6 n=1 Tax=Trigonopterus sp. 4 AH-2016 TaxID=1903838 RepID=A0A343C421_9CUCU|nr:NADH dehydrogenase subunit 6 [Trigonopterus sp. 4 AH-2016]
MLMIILLLNCALATIFLSLNHPLSLGCVLLLQTILIALVSGYFYLNFWFSYILFLIMIGGMLVMFIYMTSVASNEKFKLPKNSAYFLTCLMMLLILITYSTDEFLYLSADMSKNLISQNTYMINFSMNKYFNYPGNPIMISLMIYLFITLIAIVKITDKNFGSLRQK